MHKMHKIYTIPFALAALLLAGFAFPQPIDIRGIAKDSATGKPIPGLVVVLDNKKLKDTTDENGLFHLSNMDPKKISPLRRLNFSSDRGFAMQMGEPEEVIAEIVNGAGRAILRGQFNLAEGGWSLRPKNLAPGLYTVHLWTGSQLRALRLDIADKDRGRGAPAWTLEKLPDDYTAWGSSAVDSLRTENPDYAPAAVPVVSWTQLRVSLAARHKGSGE